jgi:membrane protein YqaA with SNARE-associated domain
MAQEHDERHFIPRPPSEGNTSDFIVTVFAIMVASILFLLTGAAVLAVFISDVDAGPFFAIITDLMTTVIGALVGYLAGRGSGRADAAEDARRDQHYQQQQWQAQQRPPGGD